MAIHKFYMIYKGMEEELGDDMALKLFPEYSKLPEKMSAADQARLGKVIIERMDELLDKNTIIKVRHKYCCNIPKKHIEKINELKEKYSDIDKLIFEYSKFLSPGYIKKNGNTLTFSFGWGKCICGMFRKLEVYELVSKTWCECCNGHVIKILSKICEKDVSSKIIEGVACGGKDCVFEIVYD